MTRLLRVSALGLAGLVACSRALPDTTPAACVAADDCTRPVSTIDTSLAPGTVVGVVVERTPDQRGTKRVGYVEVSSARRRRWVPASAEGDFIYRGLAPGVDTLTVHTTGYIGVAIPLAIPERGGLRLFVSMSRAPCPLRGERASSALNLLASAWTPASSQGVYDPARARPLDVERLMTVFAEDGITLYDVNGDRTWDVKTDALREQFRQHRGSAYDMLLHLGYVFSRSFTFRGTSDISPMVLDVGAWQQSGVGDWYRVTTACEGRVLKVTKVQHLKTDGG